jgi:hypothetical protein
VEVEVEVGQACQREGWREEAEVEVEACECDTQFSTRNTRFLLIGLKIGASSVNISL